VLHNVADERDPWANPLRGVPLEKIVTELVEAYGFAELGRRISSACFQDGASVASSLDFLRCTPWARTRLERLYLLHLRAGKRQALRVHAADVRGVAAILGRATRGMTDVVQDMHTAIGAFPLITDLVYDAVRGVIGLVSSSLDAAVAALEPLLGESHAGAEREAVLAALNGVIGDHLEATHNPLAIQMSLRPPLDGLCEGGTLLVLVHGSCMNDLQWTREGHNHGHALALDLGFTPVFVHYNSGRHISTNGGDLARVLVRESDPFRDLVIIGHSMGGLVARAAIHAAEQAHHPWRGKLRALITLGAPHHGAPLERAGNVFETLLGVSRWSAPLAALGRLRSAGVTDLRYGSVRDADWQSGDRFAPGVDLRLPTPVPEGVRCCAVAGTNSPPGVAEAALSWDNLVPVKSALGVHEDGARTLRFTDSQIAYRTHHVELLSSPDVYRALHRWLATAQPSTTARR
jgi:uncharacterized protein (DUF2132 family)/pimeloyl-ACP methyl ester carboxylesterase